MNSFRVFIGGVLIVFVTLATQNTRAQQTSQEHIVMRSDQLKWGPPPPGLPAGAQATVLEGDPSKAGEAFSVQLKMPDGYKIMPHWHPTDEKIVVVQGTLGLGMGEKFDTSASHELKSGSFAVMPKQMRHYAWSKGETIVHLYGTGPFGINYVRAEDDPRSKEK